MISLQIFWLVQPHHFHLLLGGQKTIMKCLSFHPFILLILSDSNLIQPHYVMEWSIGKSSTHTQSFIHFRVQLSHSVVSDSLWPHGLQHARPPCPSPTLEVYSNSCPLSWWCHPTISSSVVPFSPCLQSFPASGCFPMSQFFTWGGQSTGVSALASVLPMNIQDWFSLGWTVGSPYNPRDSQESSPTPQFKSINSLALSFIYSPTLTSIHDHWKNHSFD